MEEKIHRLTLKDRKELILSGVTEVGSSEDKRISLKTILGNMEVEGQDLRILNLDLVGGEASIGGKIDALLYLEPEHGEKSRLKSRRRSGKLFR